MTPIQRIEGVLNAAKECKILRTGHSWPNHMVLADPSWAQIGRVHIEGLCEHGGGLLKASESADPALDECKANHWWLTEAMNHLEQKGTPVTDKKTIKECAGSLLRVRDTLVKDHGYIAAAEWVMQVRDTLLDVADDIPLADRLPEDVTVEKVTVDRLDSLADNLRWYRNHYGLSLHTLGRDVNLKSSTIKRIEDGITTTPHTKTLMKLADYFGIRVEDLDPAFAEEQE